MFFVDQGDVDSFFHLAMGSKNPYWSISSDSDALRLGGTPECSDIACELNAVDVARIRSLTGELQEVPCSLSFYGQQFNVLLIGCRTSDNKWHGVASARSARSAEYAVG